MSICIVLMIVVFIAYFAIRASCTYHDVLSNMSNIIVGSMVAGIGTGLILSILLCCILPTHYYITAPNHDGYYKRFVIDNNFTEEYGRTYIVNLTKTDYYLCSMVYGVKSLDEDDDPFILLKSGYIVETKHDVDAWFEQFPPQVSSKSSGEIRWHVLTEEQANKEYN